MKYTVSWRSPGKRFAFYQDGLSKEAAEKHVEHLKGLGCTEVTMEEDKNHEAEFKDWTEK